MKKNKIHIISTNRADFGLLSNLINKLKLNKKFLTKFVLTGSHLHKKFGSSINEINDLKIKIDYLIRINEDFNKNASTEQNICKYINKFSIFFNKFIPDIIIVLGDRYELLGICLAAAYNNIPIAHISGGETTLGSQDEFNRHCITKLSWLHFTSNNIYKKRVIQLGENPSRVFNVGSLFLDTISNLKFSSKKTIEKKHNFLFHKKNILITFHPVTNEPHSTKKYVKEILKSLEKKHDIFFIFTSPNSDKGSDEILKEISIFIKNRKNNSILIKSFGHQDYLSTLNYVDAVIGNSSSGLTEVPYFNIPTINLGDRQKGRYLAKTIVNCPINEKSITKSITNIYNNNYKNNFLFSKISPANSPSRKIINILAKTKLNKILKKKFYDLK